ncbi:MAG: Gfo/Idh/MocA family oxidoreductase [Terriglobia bacterium]|jgi:predicted dehydrogenase
MKKVFILIVLFSLGASMGFAQSGKTRFAIVGLDHDHVWGRMETLLKTPDAELVAIADLHPELIEKAKSRVPPSVKFFRDYTEMLDQMKPDAVIVTTANNLHLPILRACAHRHIHYFTEKPMAASGADAREMSRLASAAGIKLMVNYWNIWSPATQEAAARLKAGELGPIQKIIAEFGHEGPKEIGASKEFNAWLYDPKKNGAGALMDFACYGANWAMWMKGRPERVFAYSLKLKTAQHNEVEDDAVVLLEYSDASAILLPSWDWPYNKSQAEFYGPQGSLLVLDDGLLYQPAKKATSLEHPSGAPVSTPPLSPEKLDGITYFVDCIRNNKPIEGPVSAELNVGVNEIIDAAIESIRTGKAVSLTP